MQREMVSSSSCHLTSARRFKVNEFYSYCDCSGLFILILLLVTAESGSGHVLGLFHFALPAGGCLSSVLFCRFGFIHFKNSFQDYSDVIKVFVVPFFALPFCPINILGGGMIVYFLDR